MTQYGMGYFDNIFNPSIYAKPEVQHANYLPTPPAYNANMIPRSNMAMPALPSHVNVHNSYTTTGMPSFINHNVYIPEHISNAHNGFIPPYSSAVFASHCTPQTHVPMSNDYGRGEVIASANFGQSSYVIPDSVRQEIAPNMFSAPRDVSNTFHSAPHAYSRMDENPTSTSASVSQTPHATSSASNSASHVTIDHSRVDENSTNTYASGTDVSDFGEGFDTKLTLEDLLEENHRALEVVRQDLHMKVKEAFKAHYEVTSQGSVLQDTKPFNSDVSKVPEVELTAEQNNCSDDVQSSDCISVPSNNGSASILGPHPSADVKGKSQDSDDMHNSKTSPANDDQEDSASDDINEETSHPTLSIDTAEQQSCSSVCDKTVDGHPGTGGQISHQLPSPTGAFNLEGKKILVRPSQAETTKGKNVIVGESRKKIQSTVKKPKRTSDELSAKHKKEKTHSTNRNFRNIKPELPVSLRRANVAAHGRRDNSKKSGLPSKAKLHSQDRRQSKNHTSTPSPPFRHSMTKPWRHSSMMLHPYFPWFGWYAPPMPFKSFYPKSVEHTPHDFYRSPHPKNDRFCPKNRSNISKAQRLPNRKFRFWNLEVPVFPEVGRTEQPNRKFQFRNPEVPVCPEFGYHVKNNANSSEAVLIRPKKADTTKHKRVIASKPTYQNTKPKDDVPTSSNRISQHASKTTGKSKMMWVPKGSTPMKAEPIARTSIPKPTSRLDPHTPSKMLLAKHTNKKADPWSYDRTWNSRRQAQGQKLASEDQDHWRSHRRFSSSTTPMNGSYPGYRISKGRIRILAKTRCSGLSYQRFWFTTDAAVRPNEILVVRPKPDVPVCQTGGSGISEKVLKGQILKEQDLKPKTCTSNRRMRRKA